MTLLGNHDQGAMFDPDGFNIGAERAIFWTREQLEAPSDREGNQRRWEFLGELPRSHRYGPFLFVHGSPRNPLSEYIFPEDIYNHRKMERLFQLVGRYCFQGHTHVPGIFTENYQFFAPEEIDLEYSLGEGKVMVNVGRSVNRATATTEPAMSSSKMDCWTRVPTVRPSAARRQLPVRPRSPTADCFTILRKPSRKSTPFPSLSPSWATGSDKDGSLLPKPPRKSRTAATGSLRRLSSLSASHDQRAAASAFRPRFCYSSAVDLAASKGLVGHPIVPGHPSSSRLTTQARWWDRGGLVTGPSSSREHFRRTGSGFVPS